MNHHTDQRFQREAHGDVRFSVTTRTAGHRMARNCNAQQGMELQSNADRHLATGAFPGRFGPSAMHCRALQSNATHGKAPHGNASQFKATRIGVWQQTLFRAALVRMPRWAMQGTARYRNSMQVKATRIGAWQQALFRAALGPVQCKGLHGIAGHCNAANCISKQRGLPTGNSGFSGPLWLTRPGFLGRFIN